MPVTAPARAWGQQGATATGSTCVSPTGHPLFLICLWAPSGDKPSFLGVKLLTLGKDQGFLFSFNPFVLVLMLHLGVFSPCNQAHLCFIPTLLHQCFFGGKPRSLSTPDTGYGMPAPLGACSSRLLPPQGPGLGTSRGFAPWTPTVESGGGSGGGAGLQGGRQHFGFDGHAALAPLRPAQARQLGCFLQRRQELVQLLQLGSKLRKEEHRFLFFVFFALLIPVCLR